MQIEYIAVKEEIKNESGELYISYGIEVREDGRTIRRVPDVTMNEKEANDFASLCTRLKLDPIQLDEAIYDLLCAV
ncbi:MAG: hypothetical protein J6I45_02385 [Clostridia bacterium]|nr:hypothetical protein [Clostridia bacterium]